MKTKTQKEVIWNVGIVINGKAIHEHLLANDDEDENDVHLYFQSRYQHFHIVMIHKGRLVKKSDQLRFMNFTTEARYHLGWARPLLEF